jgi:hypothetical protein
LNRRICTPEEVTFEQAGEVRCLGEPVLVLHEGGGRDGYDVVPGFTCPGEQLFA